MPIKYQPRRILTISSMTRDLAPIISYTKVMAGLSRYNNHFRESYLGLPPRPQIFSKKLFMRKGLGGASYSKDP
jgi:hypothetical protein